MKRQRKEELLYNRPMNRDEIKTLMLSKGFKFEKTTKSYPGRRGDEDIYTRRPDYKYTFRVSRVDENSFEYGLYVGIGDQYRQIDALVEHDVDAREAWGGDKPLPMWTGDNLVELMNHFDAESDRSHGWDKADDEELITVILPTINNS
jgi:hypothetical protein